MWKRATEVGLLERRLELLFRVGVAGCFIGHGAFGIIGKEAWLPYFAVAGIPEEWAWRLMPVVGTFDIVIGILTLLAPRGAFLGYAAGWALWTALLRPLAGESVFETLERAGNYGIPLAFLILLGLSLRPTRDWLRTVDVPALSEERRRHVGLVLRATVVSLMVGHGGLSLIGKPLLLAHTQAIGLPDGALPLMGALEIALAAAIAIKPAPGILLFVLFWKVGTEALYPVTGAPFWEFIERAGSYIAPLALWTLTRSRSLGGARVGVTRLATVAAAIVAALSLLSAAGPAAVPPALGGVEVAPGEAAAAVSPGEVAVVRTAGEEVVSSHLSLLGDLQAGGLVLACRHAITDRSRGDARRLDRTDRSTQRLLSDEGEAQARQLGEILRRQEIPIGEVYTSPLFRAADSAELSFGKAEVREVLYSGGTSAERRRLVTSVPEAGTNRVLMTHQGVLYGLFPGLERGSIREGDCVVVRPTGTDFRIIDRLGPSEFAALR